MIGVRERVVVVVVGYDMMIVVMLVLVALFDGYYRWILLCRTGLGSTAILLFYNFCWI